jgi:precorrin-6B methylase 2
MRKWIGVGLSLVLTASLSATAQQAQAPRDWGTLRDEETAREEHQRVADIFDAMRLQPGAVVADVGAGGGFLTTRLARAVGPEGRVLAVDIDPRVLERLRARVQREALANVEVIRGDHDDPHLVPASLDAAVIVNAYHEMRAYQAILDHLRRALKPEGRLVIVEPLSEKRRHEPREALARVHEIALPFVEDEVRGAGFRVARTEDPFTTRGSEIMWLLVAVPDPQGSSSASSGSTIESDAASTTTSPAQEAGPAALSSPGLRIESARFKRLRDGGEIVVVDVRTAVEYRSAHIPGAISIPLDSIADEIERLRALRKPIVTYCA